jgi:hypothetical protein
MITNERQRRLAATQVTRFERAIADAESESPGPDMRSRLHGAMIDAMRSQLADLEGEVRAYDDLRAGRIRGASLGQ